MFVRARTRFLQALGLEAISLLAGCDAPKAGSGEGAALVQSAPSATAAVAPGFGFGPSVSGKAPEIGFGKAANQPTSTACPHGTFCVSEPKGGPKTAASEPFSKCEAAVAAPVMPQFASVKLNTTRTGKERDTSPTLCCYDWSVPCPGGRALRDDGGAPMATQPRAGSAWNAAPSVLLRDLQSDERAAIVAHWTREAGFEHASIASFARTTLELLALGAPPDLLVETQAAGIDEVRHAEALYGIASFYGGHPVEPGPLMSSRPLTSDPASFAVATCEDACVGETVACLTVRRSAEYSEDLTIRTTLRTIADDEERHAELAWRTLAWALRSGGEEAHCGLAEAVTRLEREALGARRTAGPSSLARHGVLGDAEAQALRLEALAQVVLPCARALLAATSQAQAFAPSSMDA